MKKMHLCALYYYLFRYKMSVPSSYSDLGKNARDLFSKGFNYGFFKLEAKTKTQSNVEFKANGNSNHDSGKVVGALETKYKCKDYGKQKQ